MEIPSTAKVFRDALRLAAALATPSTVSVLGEQYRAARNEEGKLAGEFDDMLSLMKALSSICGPVGGLLEGG